MQRRGRLLPGIVEAYIAREYLFSFLVSFLFFFIIFFVNQLLLMAEDILSKRAPVNEVLLLLLFSTPAVVAMSVPFASLVGALMAVGRFAADSEYLIFQASGMRRRRIFLPFLVVGLLLSALSFAVNDVFLPLGTIEFGKIYRKLLVSAPSLELQSWSSKKFNGITLVTGDVTSTTISDLLIFDRTAEGQKRVISAKKAWLETLADENAILLKLDKVWTQTLKDGASQRFEYSSCASMEYRIELSGTQAIRTTVGPREMSSRDLWKSIATQASSFDGKSAQLAAETATVRANLADAYYMDVSSPTAWEGSVPDLSRQLSMLRTKEQSKVERRNLDLYLLEYHKKYSIPTGAAVFVLLAFPIGARARRAGRSVGFGLGLLIAVVYWALLIGGQTLGTRLGFDPALAMWLPNIVIGAVGAVAWLGGGAGR
ncbi:MAG: LptF/LptG family permease [Rectinemataceae bacterium]